MAKPPASDQTSKSDRAADETDANASVAWPHDMNAPASAPPEPEWGRDPEALRGDK